MKPPPRRISWRTSACEDWGFRIEHLEHTLENVIIIVVALITTSTLVTAITSINKALAVFQAPFLTLGIYRTSISFSPPSCTVATILTSKAGEARSPALPFRRCDLWDQLTPHPLSFPHALWP
jgi:hypothetical protein